MATFKTYTSWKAEHLGEIVCSNGAKMLFSDPAAAEGKPDLITPEDAFVGSLNMCFQLMFIWSSEKLKISLLSYECEAEGFVEEFLDRTSAFRRIVLRPKIEACDCTPEVIRKALNLAEKYSLIAQSLKPRIVIEPEIRVLDIQS